MIADTHPEGPHERMSEAELAQFLASQRMGVLGLAGPTAPVLRPAAFWFDGEDRIYLLEEYGPRTAEPVERQRGARFLVFRAETPFMCRSVVLTGSLQEVSAADRDRALDRIDMPLVPEISERVKATAPGEQYALEIEEAHGIKCVCLPPGMSDQRLPDDGRPAPGMATQRAPEPPR